MNMLLPIEFKTLAATLLLLGIMSATVIAQTGNMPSLVDIPEDLLKARSEINLKADNTGLDIHVYPDMYRGLECIVFWSCHSNLIYYVDGIRIPNSNVILPTYWLMTIPGGHPAEFEHKPSPVHGTVRYPQIIQNGQVPESRLLAVHRQPLYLPLNLK